MLIAGGSPKLGMLLSSTGPMRGEGEGATVSRFASSAKKSVRSEASAHNFSTSSLICSGDCVGDAASRLDESGVDADDLSVPMACSRDES